MMHKKDVLSAGQATLIDMEKPHHTNSDFNVCGVIEHLSGKRAITVLRSVSTGSDCGLPKVAPSDYCVNCPATVPLNLKASRITGLNESPKSTLITLRYGI